MARLVVPGAPMYPKESDCGSVKISGTSAAGTEARPAPSTSTDASWVLLVSANAGPAVDMSADFTCSGVQAGWRSRRRAAAPDTCGAEKLVPSRTANWSPANSGSVDDRICAPGAVTSGLSALPKGVKPLDVKLVGTPAQLVPTSSTSRLNRIVAAPPDPAIACLSRAPSRSEIVPPLSLNRGNVGSPGRFSAMTIPIAPASLARAAFASYGHPPRLTSAIAPRSDPAGSAGPSPQSKRLAPPMVPTSTSRWSVVVQEGGMSRVGTKAIRPRSGETTEMDSPNT